MKTEFIPQGTNEITLYVVISESKQEEVYRTSDKNEANRKVKYNSDLFLSVYPPFTYCMSKIEPHILSY